MNYQEALAYIYSFTDFERGDKYVRDRNENLPREATLLALLGNPHQEYSSTHIAGTKGKGSTAALIESVVRAAGLRTGLYTQPDLHTFRERIRISGCLISEEEVAALIPEVRRVVQEIEARNEFGPFITYEVGTALAFLAFARQRVQHAVVEVGLGGRLDATNIIHPLVSVITSISFDHMHVLGNTLAKIATEKAGIIKPNGVVVTSTQSPEALLAIAEVCQQRNARLVRVGPAQDDAAAEAVSAGKLPPISYYYAFERQSAEGQHFSIQTPNKLWSNLIIPLLGRHQLENAAAAFAALDVLRDQGIDWNETSLRQGFRTVHWPARIEVVGQNPTIIVDGAHNADSMHKLMQALQVSFSFHRLHIVLGISSDKDMAGVVDALSEADSVILTKMNSPRAASIERLEALFAERAPQVKLYKAGESSQQALDLVVDLADSNDLICVTGSLYLAGEALRWAAAHGSELAASEIEGVDH